MPICWNIFKTMSPAAVHVFRMAGHFTRAIVEGEANDAANGQGPRIDKIEARNAWNKFHQIIHLTWCFYKKKLIGFLLHFILGNFALPLNIR